MKPTKKQILKSNRKGSREAFLENGLDKSLVTKVHKSKKKYTRKKKYKDSLL